jgi:hypothetical protein
LRPPCTSRELMILAPRLRGLQLRYFCGIGACQACLVSVNGGSPAGVAAATELADLGQRVVLVEQRDLLGGAIHRAYVGPGVSPLPVVARHRRHWATLAQRLVQAGDRIETHYESVFLSMDGDGRFLLDERLGGRVIAVRPKAVVLAVGAMEVVMPRPGWELPGCDHGGRAASPDEGDRACPAGTDLGGRNGTLAFCPSRPVGGCRQLARGRRGDA